MTSASLCHNATWPASRLTPDQARLLRPASARTITYYRDDESSWRATLAACRDLKQIGVHNLVLFNTEAHGGTLRDISGAQKRLERFLAIARDEFGSPVDALEPINEADTPGWHDGTGTPITAQLCVDVTYGYCDVAGSYGVEVIGPSFLGGPTSEMVVRTLEGLNLDGRVKAASMHFYGRSILGQPRDGWIWGSVEQAVEDMRPYLGRLLLDITEDGCWSVADTLGQTAQAAYVQALCTWQHPLVRRHYYFALNDAVVPAGELQDGKDWGLYDMHGTAKAAAAAFRGPLVLAPPAVPGDGDIGPGFRTWQAREPQIVGQFAEVKEDGPWPGVSAIRTKNPSGWLFWANTVDSGPVLCYFGDSGVRRRWREDWPKSEEVAA